MVAVLKQASKLRDRLASIADQVNYSDFTRSRSTEGIKRTSKKFSTNERRSRSFNPIANNESKRGKEAESTMIGKAFGRQKLHELLPIYKDLLKIGGQRNTIAGVRKVTTTIVASLFCKVEHACVARTILERFKHAFDNQNQHIFQEIIKEQFHKFSDVNRLFSEMIQTNMDLKIRPDSTTNRKQTPDQLLDASIINRLDSLTSCCGVSCGDKEIEIKLKGAVTAVAKASGLSVIASDWLSLSFRVYQAALGNNGIILLGPSPSGKTTCIKSLVKALSKIALPRWAHFKETDASECDKFLIPANSEISVQHIMYHFYPNSFENPVEELYSPNGLFRRVFEGNSHVGSSYILDLLLISQSPLAGTILMGIYLTDIQVGLIIL
ncbi:hypothetical protein Ciccas_000412 [Cichlidogyrus casuarinus]|uniref:Uncharacterized protein n=1 Tax=Cichlidogyrus casuarinus TaxID=1844966 RepID=A0ABD2QN25_9PLAT